MSIKISNDTIGNRTRYLPACCAVPQPTARLHVKTLYAKHGLAVGKRRLYGEITLTQETFALLGYYTALSGISLPTFRDNVSVLSSMVQKPFTTRCVIRQKIAVLCYFATEPWNQANSYKFGEIIVCYILQCLQSELPQRTVFLINPFHGKRYGSVNQLPSQYYSHLVCYTMQFGRWRNCGHTVAITIIATTDYLWEVTLVRILISYSASLTR